MTLKNQCHKNSNKNHKQKRDHTQNQIKVSCLLKGDHQISGKKRDDLQEAIAALRAKTFDMPLQFNNFRD